MLPLPTEADLSFATTHRYDRIQYELLSDFASRYIWWKSPQEAIMYPERILAQVMNLGTYEDLGRLLAIFTVEDLRPVVLYAEPGWFTDRSWAFWYVRFGLIPYGSFAPALPTRITHE